MTTTSPWAGPTTSAPAGPPAADVMPPAQADPRQLPPPPPVPHFPPSGTGPVRKRPRGWVRPVVTVVVVLALMALTAAVTYQFTRPTDAAAPAAAPPPVPAVPPAPAIDPAAAAAARDNLCSAFDTTTKNTKGAGGVVKDGEINVPVVLRTLGSVIAVENALNRPVDPRLAAAGRSYADTNLALANAALARESIERLVQLNEEGNAATIALARECGLS